MKNNLYIFANANLFFHGCKMDINGNKCIILSFPNSRKFTIQAHNFGSTFYCNDTINNWATECKIIAYLKEHGTKSQKSMLKIY